MRDGSGFGVVLIREGAEAGTPAVTFDVGTYARIVDFSQQPDGLLGIRAAGERRFRILERRRARDGLNLADVEWLAEERPEPLPAEFAELAPAHRRHPHAGGRALHLAGAAPRRRGVDLGRLAEILPVPSVHKQHCLELDDPVERLRYLRPMFEIGYK